MRDWTNWPVGSALAQTFFFAGFLFAARRDWKVLGIIALRTVAYGRSDQNKVSVSPAKVLCTQCLDTMAAVVVASGSRAHDADPRHTAPQEREHLRPCH